LGQIGFVSKVAGLTVGRIYGFAVCKISRGVFDAFKSPIRKEQSSKEAGNQRSKQGSHDRKEQRREGMCTVKETQKGVQK
jgi:hypothetical protein